MDGNVCSVDILPGFMEQTCTHDADVTKTSRLLSDVKHKQWAPSGGLSTLSVILFMPTFGCMLVKFSWKLSKHHLSVGHLVSTDARYHSIQMFDGPFCFVLFLVFGSHDIMEFVKCLTMLHRSNFILEGMAAKCHPLIWGDIIIKVYTTLIHSPSLYYTLV